MKVTKDYLKQIIKEEISNLEEMSEDNEDPIFEALLAAESLANGILWDAGLRNTYYASRAEKILKIIEAAKSKYLKRPMAR